MCASADSTDVDGSPSTPQSSCPNSVHQAWPKSYSNPFQATNPAVHQTHLRQLPEQRYLTRRCFYRGGERIPAAFGLLWLQFARHKVQHYLVCFEDFRTSSGGMGVHRET